jgi:hypothetical protein
LGKNSIINMSQETYITSLLIITWNNIESFFYSLSRCMLFTETILLGISKEFSLRVSFPYSFLSYIFLLSFTCLLANTIIRIKSYNLCNWKARIYLKILDVLEHPSNTQAWRVMVCLNIFGRVLTLILLSYLLNNTIMDWVDTIAINFEFKVFF